MKDDFEIKLEDNSEKDNTKTLWEYDNFTEMLKDKKTYAKLNGNNIIQQDLPMQLKIGYKCETTEKFWACKMSNIKKTCDISILKALSTLEGKNNLLDDINNKI